MNDEKIEYLEEDIYGNTYRALELLLLNSRSMQRKCKNSSWESGREQAYLREICTVRVNGARSSGNSSALVKLALEYFNSAIFIHPSIDISHQVFNLFEKFSDSIIKKDRNGGIIKLDNENTYHFMSSGCLKELRGVTTEAIFVDGISDIEYNNKGKMDEIYVYDIGSRCMSNNPYKFFIFVG